MSSLETKIAAIVSGMNLTDAQINQLTANLVAMQNQALIDLDDDVAKLKSGTHLTAAGFNLLAKALAGRPLVYTKAQFGDSTRNGQVVITTREAEYNFTELINPKDFELPLTDCAFGGAGTAVIKFRVNNVTLTEGFFARELGIFARDPDTNQEVLYCYRNSGNLCDYIPPIASNQIVDEIMAVTTVVDDATNVTAIIDTSLAFITTHEFTEHVEATNPHPNIPNKKADVTTADMFWVTQNDSHLHRISVDNARLLILGGDASTIPRLEKRINQTEINLSNLAMQLQAESDFGFKPNLMLIEDFTDTEYTDDYQVKVVGEVAGVNGVQIETDEGILVGHWYTLTDMSNQEYVQIKSVAKNTSGDVAVIIAIFESKLTNTFDLSRAKLVRSTSLFRNGHAEGSGEVWTWTWYNDHWVWKGQGANEETTQVLDTTQTNAKAFDLSGDYAFTSNGEFTIAVTD